MAGNPRQHLKTVRTFLKAIHRPRSRSKSKNVLNILVASDGVPCDRPILKYLSRIKLISLTRKTIQDDALDIKLYQAYHDLQVQLACALIGTKLFADRRG